MLNFKYLELEDKPVFEKYTLCHGYHNLEASFANIFLWRKAWNIKMAADEYTMYLLLDNGKTRFMLAPFLLECEINFGEPLKKCEEYMRSTFGSELLIKGVTQRVKERIEKDCPQEYEFIPDRSNFEYVYLAKDLCELAGKKYHAKRNHINRLISAHSVEYRRYNEEYYDACIDLQKAWASGKDDDPDGYQNELVVIKEALSNLDTLGLKCGLLFVNGNLEAYSIGEKFEDDMAIIHIEKANPDIQGTYAMINREFVKNEWCGVTYINREEDMGLEGLRKAKLSYNPVFLLEKYTCIRSK
ncbi:MAG: phosphatidylglycerol lysyltransferase domain-containing protein [Eubacteriales bacterium]|nr:phosphatidylglycerol lysyltransferase domain-containing protein [Eubacteriales bacterium]